MPPVQATQQRRTVLILFLIGLAIIVLLVSVLGYILLDRHLHDRNWIHARATVEFTGVLCEIQYKDTRYWLTEDVVDCADAERKLSERRQSSYSLWRSEKTEYAEITYTVAGQTRTKRLIQWLISTRPLTVGEDVGILVDPDDPTRVDRPNSSDDYGMAIQAIFVAMIAWFILGFLVWLLARYVPRKGRHG